METLVTAGIMSAKTAATMSTVATVASTGFSAISALSQISQGRQQAAIYKAQARDSEIQAKQEEINGRENSLRALKQLNRDLSLKSPILFRNSYSRMVKQRKQTLIKV